MKNNSNAGLYVAAVALVGSGGLLIWKATGWKLPNLGIADAARRRADELYAKAQEGVRTELRAKATSVSAPAVDATVAPKADDYESRAHAKLAAISVKNGKPAQSIEEFRKSLDEFHADTTEKARAKGETPPTREESAQALLALIEVLSAFKDASKANKSAKEEAQEKGPSPIAQWDKIASRDASGREIASERTDPKEASKSYLAAVNAAKGLGPGTWSKAKDVALVKWSSHDGITKRAATRQADGTFKEQAYSGSDLPASKAKDIKREIEAALPKAAPKTSGASVRCRHCGSTRGCQTKCMPSTCCDCGGVGPFQSDIDARVSAKLAEVADLNATRS